MKKNITINLFGTLYAIDEDAYDLLNRYEENMRSYFRRKEGGGEIADDIEYRVAELLAEMKAGGTEAITIEHVEEIIRRIGNPEQVDDSEAAADTEEQTDSEEEENSGHRGLKYMMAHLRCWMARRKLFRDTQDSMIGGVMSGLCSYFGGTDPLPWRIGMVLLCLLSFSTVAIVYLILWAFIPQARTTEDRLWMKGKPVNAESINEELMRGVNKPDKQPAHTPQRTQGRGFLNTLLGLVISIVKCGLFLAGALALFCLLFLLVCLSFFTFGGMNRLVESGWIDFEQQAVWQAIPGGSWLAWTFVLSLLVALGILLYALIRWMGASREPMASRTRATLLIGWLAAVGIAIASGIIFVALTDQAKELIHTEYNTRNGICIKGNGWNKLDQRGWQVLQLENAEPYIDGGTDLTRDGDYYRVIEFERNDLTQPLKFRIERSENLPAGTYRVEALVHGSRNGGCLYVYPVGAENPLIAQEVTYGNPLPGSHLHTAFFQSGKGEEEAAIVGRHWEYLLSDTIHHPGGTLRYGFTNDTQLTGRAWSGNEFEFAGASVIAVDATHAATPAEVPADSVARPVWRKSW